MGTLLFSITSSSERGDEFTYSPIHAHITSLAVYDVERKSGALYVTNQVDTELADWVVKQRSEQQMLEDFWLSATSYDTFVSFNGRSYALPFILHRSIFHKLKPTAEIARQRYLTKQRLPYHVDLLDELSLYGAMQRAKLSDFCSLYNIPLPEVGSKSMSEATVLIDLFEIWKEYMAPKSFINKTEF